MFYELLNFLYPDSILSWIALGILLVVFSYGKIKDIKTKRGISRLFKKSKDEYSEKYWDIKPKEYIRLNDNYDGSSHSIHSIPGFLISIGIVATFIGIGLSINKVSELISSTEVADPMALLDVLSIIAFKFQTSVYGIVLSLIFSAFILTPHIGKIQKLTDDAIKKLYEKRPSQNSLIYKLENTSTELKSTIDKFSSDSKELNNKLIKSIDTLNTDLQKSNKVMKSHLNEMITNFGKNSEKSNQKLVESINSLNEDLQESNDIMGNHLNQMIEEINKSINESLDKIDESFKHLGTSQGESQKLLKESLSDLTTDVESVMEKVQDSISSMNESIEEKLVVGIHNLNENLDGSLDNLNEHMSILSSHMKTLNVQKSEFNAEMNNINENINQLSSLISEILKNEFKNNFPTNGDFSS